MLVHRSLGKPAFHLLLGRGILLLIGCGMASGVNPVAEIGVMWTTLPDMPLAFLAFGLLVVVIVSSFVAVRRRFRYRASLEVDKHDRETRYRTVRSGESASGLLQWPRSLRAGRCNRARLPP
jgi:hypothetical protein